MTPDFLVIGAQKSGTTWLDRNLRSHPQICLPPEKEIHYFDFPPLIPFCTLLISPERSIRHWAMNRMRRDYQKVRAGQQTAAWYARYYLFPRTRNWYKSLFTPGSNQIAGEATPRYAILPENKLKDIFSLMPNAKIIYLLRNPMDRIWSDVAMFHSAKFGFDGLERVDAGQIIKFLSDSMHLASSRYMANLERWEKFYPKAQIFVGFYEQIRDTPEQLLKSVYQFLGVGDSDEFISAKVTTKINAQAYPKMPADTAYALAQLLMDEMEKLHRRFDNPYTAEWLLSAQNHLQRGPGKG